MGGVKRYTIPIDEVVEVAKWAFENRMGTLMLQSGGCRGLLWGGCSMFLCCLYAVLMKWWRWAFENRMGTLMLQSGGCLGVCLFHAVCIRGQQLLIWLFNSRMGMLMLQSGDGAAPCMRAWMRLWHAFVAVVKGWQYLCCT
jgi:hypothetical protein